jgi:hypothetical protein
MNGAKYRNICDKNLLQSANNLRLGAKSYVSTGQGPQSIQPKQRLDGFRTRM